MKTGENDIRFIDNPLLNGSGDKYMSVVLDAGAVLKSWKRSLFSYEWLYPDGVIKEMDDLSETEKSKRAEVEEKLASGDALAKPVLGIGVMDNVEIGAGRAEFLTLAARGVKNIPAHIPKSNEKDFKPYRADIKS